MLYEVITENVYILGVGRTGFEHDEYVNKIRTGVEKFAQIKEKNESFYNKIGYLSLDTSNVDAYQALKSRLEEIKETGVEDNIIFYLATPPDLFVTIPSALHIQGLAKESKYIV